MHHTLGKPELVPIEAEAVVKPAGILAAAFRAAVARIERVEAEQRAVDGTSAALAAEQRLLTRHFGGRIENRLQLTTQPVGERSQLAGCYGAAFVELRGGDDEAHCAALRSKCQSCSVTSSPRRSMRTPLTRRDRP